MGLTLDALHRLQDVERELVRLRNEKNDKERAIATGQRLLRHLDEQIATKKAETQQQQLKAQQLEGEIRQREEQIAKLRHQLNVTRTTREYAAILTEINTEKADSTKIEEQALLAMQAVDQAKAEVNQLMTQREGFVQRVEKAKAVLEQFLAQTGPSWHELEGRKKEMAGDLPGQVLSQFERVAEYHEGDAMAIVLRPHPKRDEFVCGGCHMNITAELVNSLMTKDDLQYCNSCGRILYIPKDGMLSAE